MERDLNETKIEVNNDKATVVLMSFVGAASSPSGNSISFQGTRAPNQFATKINKKTCFQFVFFNTLE